MIFLLILLSIVVLRLILSINGFTNRKKIVFLTLIGMILVFVSTTRDFTVGTDTLNYVYYFNVSNRLSFSQIINSDYNVSTSYLIYNKILSYLTSDPKIMLFFNSLLINPPILMYIYKNSKYITLSIFLYLTLYYFAISLNIMRQFMVVGLFFLGLELLKNKKILLYFLVILLGTVFHSTAVILFFIPLLFYIKPTYKNLIMISSIIIIATGILYINTNLILQLGGNYTTFYLGSRYLQSSAVGGSVIIWVFQLSIFILSIYLLSNNSALIEENDRRNLFLTSILVLISVCIGVLSTRIAIINRLIYYFEIFMIILIPLVVHYLFKEKFILNFVISLVAILYCLYMIGSNFGGVIPFNFYWQI